jgi:hydroxyacylglutathione hydrolase
MSLTAQPIAILSDNYAWLLLDSATGTVAVVDPAEDAPIDAAVQRAGGRLELILLTHHHDDHIAAVEPLRARYGARVVGAAADSHRLPRLDMAVHDGDTVTVGNTAGRVLATPGHTLGHISYYFADGGILLCGDTLFSLGCGRLLEGTAEDMFGSLAKCAALPDATLVCCGHEYTKNNARFALSVDPDNAALRARERQIDQLRAAGAPTVPALLGNERRENPFLMAADVAAFARLRAAKDRF